MGSGTAVAHLPFSNSIYVKLCTPRRHLSPIITAMTYEIIAETSPFPLPSSPVLLAATGIKETSPANWQYQCRVYLSIARITVFHIDPLHPLVPHDNNAHFRILEDYWNTHVSG